jgi:integrase
MNETPGLYQYKGRWRADFFYEGQRYKKSFGAVNKTIAKEMMAIFRSEVIRGTYRPRASMTPFDKFTAKYLAFAEAENKPSSFQRKENSLKHLRKHFSGKTLSSISPFHIDAYKEIRKAERAAPGTINRELQCLRHMLNMAAKWGMLIKNPFSECKLLKEPKEKERILSQEEEERLIEVAKKAPKATHLLPIIITALQTGMRKGEILNLKWSNINFTQGFITVTRGSRTGTPKNDRSRKIPMNELLTQTLKNVKSRSTGELVFSDRDKSLADFKTAWQRVKRDAGIQNLRFHDLRHTVGTRLGMAGVDIRTLMEIMGHQDIKMTIRYLHPTSEHKRKAMDVLSDSSHPKNHPSDISASRPNGKLLKLKEGD